MFENLPEYCYAELPSTGEVIKIVKGENNYRQFANPVTEVTADQLNEAIGVTKAQREAMEIGSMFGWEVPGANPKYHEQAKQFI